MAQGRGILLFLSLSWQNENHELFFEVTEPFKPVSYCLFVKHICIFSLV